MRSESKLTHIGACLISGVFFLTHACFVFPEVGTRMLPLLEQPTLAGLVLIILICLIVASLIDRLLAKTATRLVCAWRIGNVTTAADLDSKAIENLMDCIEQIRDWRIWFNILFAPLVVGGLQCLILIKHFLNSKPGWPPSVFQFILPVLAVVSMTAVIVFGCKLSKETKRVIKALHNGKQQAGESKGDG